MNKIIKAKDGFHEIETITKDTYRINEADIVNAYLLIGKEKALLIDCGVGIGNIKETVEELTKLPIIVAVTHRHCDHDGGRNYFKNYYVHKGDKSLIYKILSSKLASQTLLKESYKKNFTLSKGPYHSKAIYMDNEMVFHLGDRDISIVNVPGHTKGSVIYLDDKNKLMFTGDDVNPYLWLQLPGCSTISAWLPGAKKALDLSNTYTPYIGHSNGLITKDDISKLISVAIKLLNKHPKFKGKNIDYPNGEEPVHIFISKNHIK